jgi:hypothetical protein
MVATSTPAEAPQASRSTPEGEVPVESEQAIAAAPPVTPAIPSTSGSRSDGAKASI